LRGLLVSASETDYHVSLKSRLAEENRHDCAANPPAGASTRTGRDDAASHDADGPPATRGLSDARAQRGLLEAFRRFGAYLPNFGQLAPADREVIIHRTTALCGADHEWAVHAFYFGEKVGLDAHTLRVTRQIDTPAAGRLDQRRNLLIRFCDELHAQVDISNSLWAQLEQVWSAAELIEMVAVAGHYRLVSVLVNALRIEHEAYARDYSTRSRPTGTTAPAGPHAHEAPVWWPAPPSRNPVGTRQRAPALLASSRGSSRSSRGVEPTVTARAAAGPPDKGTGSVVGQQGPSERKVRYEG
jgi:4-carboxymuconolactone decarboxylase